MEQAPKWYMPVAIVALLWNLIGVAAYLGDVMASADAIAKMSEADQALRAARPAWSVGATAVAVWFGTAGCVGLIMKKRWATALLLASLLGLVVQDVSFFMAGPAASMNPAALGLQGMVLAIGIALLMLARKATAQRWIS